MISEELRNKIGIGTVQFGMDYGINNKHGKAGKEEVNNILEYALKNSIDTIDTASGYGESEKVIGGYKELNKFKVVSKIPECGINEVDDYISSSFTNLGLESIYGLLIHSFDTFKRNKDVLEKVRVYKNAGRIKKIGFSLYYTGDLDYLLEKEIQFDIIQIPYSIFDRRFEKYFVELKNRNIEIHTRSVYLQGLIFMNVNDVHSYFEDFKSKLTELEDIARKLNMSKQEIALNYCLNNENISKVIIGFDNEKQIKEAVESIKKFNVVKQNYDKFEVLKEDEENYLLPFNWKLN